jgi:glycosyltransferase involved in cell wall biosynthesis
LPAIIANVRDADRIVDHGVNGYLCDQEPVIFAKRIIELLQNQELRIEMAKAAREKVKRTFDSEKRMDPILSLIVEKVPLESPVAQAK